MNAITASGCVSNVVNKTAANGSPLTTFDLEVFSAEDKDLPLHFSVVTFGAMAERAAQQLRDGSWCIATGRLKALIFRECPKVSLFASNIEVLGSEEDGNEAIN